MNENSKEEDLVVVGSQQELCPEIRQHLDKVNGFSEYFIRTVEKRDQIINSKSSEVLELKKMNVDVEDKYKLSQLEVTRVMDKLKVSEEQNRSNIEKIEALEAEVMRKQMTEAEDIQKTMSEEWKLKEEEYKKQIDEMKLRLSDAKQEYRKVCDENFELFFGNRDPKPCIICNEEIDCISLVCKPMLQHLEYKHSQGVCPVCWTTFDLSIPGHIIYFKMHVNNHSDSRYPVASPPQPMIP